MFKKVNALLTVSFFSPKIFLMFCLFLLHQSYLTITAGTENCPILGGLGSNLYLLRRELRSLTCLRMALPEHRASM